MNINQIDLETIVLLKIKNDKNWTNGLIEFLNSSYPLNITSHEECYYTIKNHFLLCKKNFVNKDYIFFELKKKIEIYIKNNIRMKKYSSLAEYFTKLVTPTKKEQSDRGEVFTKLDFIKNDMLNLYDKKIWENPYEKWLDPANGIGNFLLCIFLILMDSLKNYVDDKLDLRDEEIRREHILTKMLYASELDKKNCILYNILLSHNGKYKLNIYNGSSIDSGFDEWIKNVWKIPNFKKFKVIGNPPYNDAFKKSNGYAIPIYPKFYFKFIKIADSICFVIPFRWRINNKTTNKFKKCIINNNLKVLKSYNSKEVFNIDIKGGICVFYIDKNYNGKTLYNNNLVTISDNVLNFDSTINSIIQKIKNKNKKYLSDIYHSKGHFKISVKDKRLTDKKETENHIICYMSKQKGFKKYIDKTTISVKLYHKVITPSASGTSEKQGFGNLIVTDINDVYSETYISFETKSLDESKNLKKYMTTKFVNVLLTLNKKTQNINKHCCSFIPLLDLDKEWTDPLIFEYFNLDKNEIDYINNKDVKTPKM